MLKSLHENLHFKQLVGMLLHHYYQLANLVWGLSLLSFLQLCQCIHVSHLFSSSWWARSTDISSANLQTLLGWDWVQERSQVIATCWMDRYVHLSLIATLEWCCSQYLLMYIFMSTTAMHCHCFSFTFCILEVYCFRFGFTRPCLHVLVTTIAICWVTQTAFWKISYQYPQDMVDTLKEY